MINTNQFNKLKRKNIVQITLRIVMQTYLKKLQVQIIIKNHIFKKMVYLKIQYQIVKVVKIYRVLNKHYN